MEQEILQKLKFGPDGLIPTVVQHYTTNETLMLAYSNVQSIELTESTGLAHFFSRSRNSMWMKGESSGNFLHCMFAYYDCDGDSLLYICSPDGPTCHTGEISCFHNKLFGDEAAMASDPAMLQKLYEIIADRKRNPAQGSYTNYLFDSGIDKILKKVGEESAETIIAAKNNSVEEITLEASDLLYHLLVLLNDRQVPLEAILACLKERHAVNDRGSQA
ncbi:MAG: bifunctional phosphoribosyl-AMP cyclohydrolase/phosphoribosyl-ATP diphosphatase HisIE [Eubacteriaceae bacterium]|nr:bifunctional phosphoribosyl-AMP cyclohydrolase/phosphoribosyl-ATP diphosphatase HisIE [Eubacteriaceae bacterium]